ncbi:hypothetical protein EDB85DRAFT_1968715 [Lactarius pseudohatsudake]|nr:hypothetical protein EDB85DRAFT_1968715 [Lactarius pseudohatsudake]
MVIDHHTFVSRSQVSPPRLLPVSSHSPTRPHHLSCVFSVSLATFRPASHTRYVIFSYSCIVVATCFLSTTQPLWRGPVSLVVPQEGRGHVRSFFIHPSHPLHGDATRHPSLPSLLHLRLHQTTSPRPTSQSRPLPMRLPRQVVLPPHLRLPLAHPAP